MRTILNIVIWLLIGILTSLSGNNTWASESSISGTPGNQSVFIDTDSISKWIQSNFRLSYYTWFSGPGLAPSERDVSPNQLGRPADDGLGTYSQIGIQYKISNRWNLDWQNRVQLVMNNARNVNGFESLRWQAPQIGVSGLLASGSTWKLQGAVNTELPYFFPEPIGGGYYSEKRTQILSPGMFASLVYREPGSRWSVFSLVTPRFYIYKDRDADAMQSSRAGAAPGSKPELTLSFSPSINYDLTSKLGLRLGTNIKYMKSVSSSWNPLNARTRNTNVPSTAWFLGPIPLQLGGTYAFHPLFNVSAYIQGFPVAGQRIDTYTRQMASFFQTTSVGMQISGAIL